MARRRIFKRTRTPFKMRSKRSGRKGAAGAGNLGMRQALGGAIYGAARGYVSGMLEPVTSRVPLGGIADEVVMLVLSHQVAKRTTGALREAGKAGFYIESARLGQSVLSGEIFSGMTTSQTSTGKIGLF